MKKRAEAFVTGLNGFSSLVDEKVAKCAERVVEIFHFTDTSGCTGKAFVHGWSFYRMQLKIDAEWNLQIDLWGANLVMMSKSLWSKQFTFDGSIEHQTIEGKSMQLQHVTSTPHMPSSQQVLLELSTLFSCRQKQLSIAQILNFQSNSAYAVQTNVWVKNNHIWWNRIKCSNDFISLLVEKLA